MKERIDEYKGNLAPGKKTPNGPLDWLGKEFE
jgi:hypothetical protein